MSYLCGPEKSFLVLLSNRLNDHPAASQYIEQWTTGVVGRVTCQVGGVSVKLER